VGRSSHLRLALASRSLLRQGLEARSLHVRDGLLAPLFRLGSRLQRALVVQQRATLPRVLLGRRLRALRRLDRLFLADLALSLSLQVGKLARCLRLLRVLLRLPRSQRSLVLRGSLRGSSLLGSDTRLLVSDG
jgi:hypothetical protein